MATITPAAWTRTVEGGRDIFVTSWALGIADTGIAVQVSQFQDLYVQVTGTIGGATVLVEGSLDNTTFATLSNQAGAAISLTANGAKQVGETPRWIRASSSGGTGSAIVVTLLARIQRPW